IPAPAPILAQEPSAVSTNSLGSASAATAPVLAADTDRITIGELELLLRHGDEPVLILDARSQRSYLDSDQLAVGALRIDPDRAVRDVRGRNVSPDTWIIAFCACPNDKTSVRIVGELREAGWPRAYALTGGWQAWIDSGRPVEAKSAVGAL
ncbi:MAG: rhodanese-like domain-containing protein, partial [Armatimonadota bacterium]